MVTCGLINVKSASFKATPNSLGMIYDGQVIYQPLDLGIDFGALAGSVDAIVNSNEAGTVEPELLQQIADVRITRQT